MIGLFWGDTGFKVAGISLLILFCCLLFWGSQIID